MREEASNVQPWYVIRPEAADHRADRRRYSRLAAGRGLVAGMTCRREAFDQSMSSGTPSRSVISSRLRAFSVDVAGTVS